MGRSLSDKNNPSILRKRNRRRYWTWSSKRRAIEKKKEQARKDGYDLIRPNGRYVLKAASKKEIVEWVEDNGGVRENNMLYVNRHQSCEHNKESLPLWMSYNG